MGLINLINKGIEKAKKAPTGVKTLIGAGALYTMLSCTGKYPWQNPLQGGIGNTTYDNFTIETGIAFNGDTKKVTLLNPQDPDGTITADLYLNGTKKGTMTRNGNNLEYMLTFNNYGDKTIKAKMSDGTTTTDTTPITEPVYMNVTDIKQAVEANKGQITNSTAWEEIKDIQTNTDNIDGTSYDLGGNKVMIYLRQWRNDIRGPPNLADFGLEITPSTDHTNTTGTIDSTLKYKGVGGISPESKIFYSSKPVKNWTDIEGIILRLKENNFYTP